MISFVHFPINPFKRPAFNSNGGRFEGCNIHNCNVIAMTAGKFNKL